VVVCIRREMEEIFYFKYIVFKKICLYRDLVSTASADIEI